jgi:hypothetical protein
MKNNLLFKEQSLEEAIINLYLDLKIEEKVNQISF